MSISATAVSARMFGALMLITTSVAQGTSVKTWDFTVYLEDSKIGIHRFEVSESGDRTVIESRAEFTVKLLIFTAYSYRHESHEIWDGRCLEWIRSRTNDNGERFRLQGESSGQQFVLETQDDTKHLPPCPQTFWYWDPRILESDRLLNSQNGEYQEIDVEDLGREEIPVRGRMMTADRFQLQTEDAVIDLWYSPDREWLALESTTAEGSRIRYRIE